MGQVQSNGPRGHFKGSRIGLGADDLTCEFASKKSHHQAEGPFEAQASWGGGGGGDSTSVWCRRWIGVHGERGCYAHEAALEDAGQLQLWPPPPPQHTSVNQIHTLEKESEFGASLNEIIRLTALQSCRKEIHLGENPVQISPPPEFSKLNHGDSNHKSTG